MAIRDSKIYHYIKTKYITWTKWEYMPMFWTNIPVFICYLYYSIRSLSITFFKYANPGIHMGGAFGVSKHEMMKDIPQGLLPKMFLSNKGEPITIVINRLKDAGIQYPIVLKPDIGERGFFVKKISTEKELGQYLDTMPCDMIIQEFLDYPLEYTLSFNSLPEQPDSFKITSVCQKGFMQLVGDGIHTGKELMHQDKRFFLQISRFETLQLAWLNRVIPKGEVIYPEPIGNHNRGTAFYDARNLISPDLIEHYKALCLGIKGIYIGRFDMKADSEKDFIYCNVKIMELNGVLGEPVHVYDPGYSPITAYKDLFAQWKTIYTISRLNRKPFRISFSFKDAIELIQNYFGHKKSLKALSK